MTHGLFFPSRENNFPNLNSYPSNMAKEMFMDGGAWKFSVCLKSYHCWLLPTLAVCIVYHTLKMIFLKLGKSVWGGEGDAPVIENSHKKKFIVTVIRGSLISYIGFFYVVNRIRTSYKTNW